jgi:hypothetical protein
MTLGTPKLRSYGGAFLAVIARLVLYCTRLHIAVISNFIFIVIRTDASDGRAPSRLSSPAPIHTIHRNAGRAPKFYSGDNWRIFR